MIEIDQLTTIEGVYNRESSKEHNFLEPEIQLDKSVLLVSTIIGLSYILGYCCSFSNIGLTD